MKLKMTLGDRPSHGLLNQGSFLGWMLLVCAAGLVGGCSSKPPGCSDPETIQTLREALVGQIQMLHGVKDDWIDKYFTAHKLGIDMMTTDGYDQNAKRHDCQATLSIGGSNATVEIRYAVQAIDGQRGRFLVKTFADSGQFVRAVWTNVEYFSMEETKRAEAEALQKLNDAEVARSNEPSVAPTEVTASAAEPAASQQEPPEVTSAQATAPGSLAAAASAASAP